MIGSPDLLAFTGTEGFGGDGGKDPDLGLPEELCVPLLPPSHPWVTSARFHRDFILVAEFSEQVGPKPVLTIPDDTRALGSFDLNHFSVRIMSVDYQASGPPHAPPASTGPHLNFSEDSKVILGDSADDAFAYVHHMTLYDLEARGMVRPFCVAYVCSDQTKLMENFSELTTSFSRAADSLKTGNRQAFSMELQRKLQELEYQRLSLLQEGEHPRMENGSRAVGGNMEELEAVEGSISIHREFLRQVTSYPNRKLKQPDFLPYDPTDSLTDPIALLPLESCHFPSTPASTSTSCRSQRHLKPLQELCNPYFLSLMKEQLADTERRLRGDRSVLQAARIAHSLSRRLTLVNFLFEPWSSEEGGEEAAEAEFQGEAGPTSGDMSLESFCSCVEEIPIKLEAGGTRNGTPEPAVAMEMTESASSCDSIEVLGTEKSYLTQNVAASNNRETPAAVADASQWRAAVDVKVRRVRAYARRTNSEDSIEVLSTTESVVPDDLTAITEEQAELQPVSNGFKSTDEVVARVRPDQDAPGGTTSVNEDEKAPPAQEDDGPINGSLRHRPAKGEGLKLHRVREEAENNSRPLEGEEAPHWSEARQGVPSAPGPPVNAAPDEDDRWPPPCAPLRLLSVDEASDHASFTGSSPPSSSTTPTLHIHSDPRLSKRRRRKAALRALRFLKQNSFSQHAVFCLLSGRPLAVIGGDEGLVTKLLDALSLFLPAPDGNAVMPALGRPLQVTDLLTWRLIGIHRSPSGSVTSILRSLTRYSRYLSLLDLDQKTLRCPSYSGSVVGRLADPQTGIGRGVTYLLHLESCLTALAHQALLYTFYPHSHREEASGAEEELLLARGVCSSESDLRVMRFLSDLIKQRHAGSGLPSLRFSYCSAHLHRNTWAT
ncbi:guanine nucleotide exchange protein smcr8b [Antennarius striatus]|uniref:guanine nucleotide exchange protein smcr8b n=1 Tax=Antennarius striatus TaxID=241820 RepID=UPI0035B4E297